MQNTSSKAEAIKLGRIQDMQDDPSLSFISFKGQGLMSAPGTNGYVPVKSDDFARLAYQRFPGISKSNIDDLLHAMRVNAPDRSDLDRFICMGESSVWDMQSLSFTTSQLSWVYHTRFEPSAQHSSLAMTFLKQLALGDEQLAHDYLQALAPIFMYKKPAGVIWFVGSGANGKSSLINAMYRILGDYFCSLTTSAIEDGRDTPRLNGVLGNICRESSESRVDDTERYKAIGTHEPFSIHKFHSQESLEITTNFHTIFNANNVPAFSDKTRGARRRTLIVPFPATFKEDPNFDDRTFTDEFLSGLLYLILEEAKSIKSNGYRYKWSDTTIKAKESYDAEVNSAEAFIEYLRVEDVCGFVNYDFLHRDYVNWCSQTGMVALGITTLKRTVVNEVSPYRRSYRSESRTCNRYHFGNITEDIKLKWDDDGFGYGYIDNTAISTAPSKEPVYVANKISEDW